MERSCFKLYCDNCQNSAAEVNSGDWVFLNRENLYLKFILEISSWNLYLDCSNCRVSAALAPTCIWRQSKFIYFYRAVLSADFFSVDFIRRRLKFSTDMFCYVSFVMLVLLWYVVLCFTIFCYVMFCYAKLVFYVMVCFVMIVLLW